MQRNSAGIDLMLNANTLKGKKRSCILLHDLAFYTGVSIIPQFTLSNRALCLRQVVYDPPRLKIQHYTFNITHYFKPLFLCASVL